METVRYRDQDGQLMAGALEDFFRRFIYEPLLDILRKEPALKIKLSAATGRDTALTEKIRSGAIVYDGRSFVGKFDAKSSRIIRELGGSWDAKTKTFILAQDKLTPSLKSAVSQSRARLERLHQGLLKKLDEAKDKAEKTVEALDLTAPLERVVSGLQTQTIKAMKAIQVKYTLTHDQREKLKKDYNENMKLYIKDWTDEHIKTLRKEVEDNALGGYRAKELEERLRYRYGTSKNKAKFLARQETSLFMSKFRRERFLDAGVDFYQWQTARDRRVRDDHKKLDGRIFQFGDPPVVDTATGRRAEPGEDFGCRCMARPITKPVRKIRTEWKIVD